MTHHNDGRSPGKSEKGKRGTVRNDRRLAALTKRRQTDKADWGGCNPDKLAAVVVAITSLGGAITFGTSRDGGAHSVTIMLDGDRETLWFNGDAELEVDMQAIVDALAIND